MKSFIITVDTEGDNLWEYAKGSPVSTENARFIPRFQELCNRYAFKPVWLTNYEMASSDRFVNYISEPLERGQCEVGIHVHAWNTPPAFELGGRYGGNPYLTEYPEEVMREKFAATHGLIERRLGVRVKSHRSGRWAMDARYFRLLEEFGVVCDCSFTPGVSWLSAPGETVTGGSDYTDAPHAAHMVGGVLEVPVTVRRYPRYISRGGSLRHRLRALAKGGHIWLRPAVSTLADMLRLVEDVDRESGSGYLEFMIHSSELMPGGSPYFSTPEDIDREYAAMDKVFARAAGLGYEGRTLAEFAAAQPNG